MLSFRYAVLQLSPVIILLFWLFLVKSMTDFTRQLQQLVLVFVEWNCVLQTVSVVILQ